eukprot:gene3169-3470_t
MLEMWVVWCLLSIFLSSIFNIVLADVKCELVIPRDKDAFYPSSCTEQKCYYTIRNIFMVYEGKNGTYRFRLHQGNITIAMFDTATQDPHGKVFFNFPLIADRSALSITLTWTVHTVQEGHLPVLLRKDVELMFLMNEDAPVMGLPAYYPRPCEKSLGHQTSCKLDYLEIGTCNFDTCIQRADAYLSKHPSKIIRGVSVEALSNYLRKLPNLRDSLKVATAVKASHHTQVADFIYFIPESIISRSNMPHHLKGSSSLTTPADTLLSGIVFANQSYSILRRQEVPLVAIEDLLWSYVHSLQSDLPSSLRLLKTDIEGMDDEVILSALEFYETRTLQEEVLHSAYLFPYPSISRHSWSDGLVCQNHGLEEEEHVGLDASWPCLIHYESFHRDPIPIRRLRYLGYDMLHDVAQDVADEMKPIDFTAVNCQCSLEDITIASDLLDSEIFRSPQVIYFSLCQAH